MSFQPTGLVQPIVVRPSTHFHTIAAAALASGLAMATADLSTDPWRTWLQGSFTKSVRRTKRDSDLDKVRALPALSTEISVGNSVAIALAPERYEDSPRAISRLQVSGLDLPRNYGVVGGFHKPGAVVPHIAVNADVAMSTGKTAAQVAHALGAWVLAQSISTRTAWADEPGLSIGALRFSEHGFSEEDMADPSVITVVDAGLTEIAPGTATVRVYLEQLA